MCRRASGAEGRDRPPEGAKLSWTLEADAAERVPVSVTLGRLPVGGGLHRLVITVTDLVGEGTATRERLVKIR